MSSFDTFAEGITGTYQGFDQATGSHSYLLRNNANGSETTVHSPYPEEDFRRYIRSPVSDNENDARASRTLLKRLGPDIDKLRSKDQRGYWQRAVAPVFRSIPAFFVGGPWDIMGLLSYVPGPEELVAMGYEAATGDDPLGIVEMGAKRSERLRERAKRWGTESLRRDYQQNLRRADLYFEDRIGYKPFGDTIGTDMTPEARGIWEKMLTSGLEFGVSAPVMIKGVTLPAKILQGGARFLFSRYAKESAEELGEDALKPENIGNLIDRANDAYSVFTRTGRKNIAAEVAFGAGAGAATEQALYRLEQLDPNAAGYVKTLVAIGAGLGGPIAARSVVTGLLQGPLVNIATRVLVDPVFNPERSAASFAQKSLGTSREDRAQVASVGMLLKEAIKSGRHVHEASGLAFTTPELARTEARILRANTQFKKDQLAVESDPAVQRRLKKEIEEAETNASSLSQYASLQERILEAAARDTTPGLASKFFDEEAKRLVARREQFFNYILTTFQKSVDDLNFGGRPGGSPDELFKDLEDARRGAIPEFENTRRKLVMEGDPKGLEASESWLEPQTRKRVDVIKSDMSRKMNELLDAARIRAEERVKFWRVNLESYLAERGVKTLDDLPEVERRYVGDIIRDTYDDVAREYRAFEASAYDEIVGLQDKVTENIRFPEGSKDPATGLDISGQTVEEWASSRLENLSQTERFNPKEVPVQLAQLSGTRSVIAAMNRRRKEAEAAGKAQTAEARIPDLEKDRDDLIAQRIEKEAELDAQMDADRILSEDNMRTLGTYVDNAIANLDDAGARAVVDFSSRSEDWAKMSAGTARGLAPKGLGSVFVEIARQKKRILELGDGTRGSKEATRLRKEVLDLSEKAVGRQKEIDQITGAFLGDDVVLEPSGRLTSRDSNGTLLKQGISANDVRETIADVEAAARAERIANGKTARYRSLRQLRETLEQLLSPEVFSTLDPVLLTFARDVSRVKRHVDESQGKVLDKTRGSEPEVPFEELSEVVLPERAKIGDEYTSASDLRKLREATAETPDFVTITRGEDGAPTAVIDEAALDGTRLFDNTGSPFELVTVGQANTPFDIRLRPDAPVTVASLNMAEAILLERLALRFPDGVDSKGLEAFRAQNKTALDFLEENGSTAIPDLVKDADVLATQIDTINSLLRDKTRASLNELVEQGALDLKGLDVEDYLDHIGQRRQRIGEETAFAEALNADPGRAVEGLFKRVLDPANKEPLKEIHKFLSLVKGSKQAEKGLQASIVGQLWNSATTRTEALFRATGDRMASAFDPAKFRELMQNPRIINLLNEAFPDNPEFLRGLEDMAAVAFETSNFTRGSKALEAAVDPKNAVSLEGWALLGRIAALETSKALNFVNTLWAAGAGGRLGATLGKRITGIKIKDILINGALDPKLGADLALKTSETGGGLGHLLKVILKGSLDSVNLPRAVVRRPGAAVPVFKRAEEESQEPVPPGPQSSLEPVRARPSRAATEVRRPPVSASILSQPGISPVGQRPTGQASQQTLANLSQLGIPLFAKHGGLITGGAGSGVGRKEQSEGIMSIQCKPRQLVG